MLKRVFAVLLTVCLLLSSLSIPAFAQTNYALDDGMIISAQAIYVVFLGNDMDADTELHSREPDTRLSPGEMIRVLFGLHAYELMEEKGIDPAIATATYTEELKDINYEATQGTGLPTAGIEVKDTWTLEKLMVVAMVAPASDAVTMITHTLTDSDDAFVKGMNELAARLGCTNTNVVNPYGIDDPNQYTTARDMYTLLRYTMLNYPALTEMMSYNSYSITPLVGDVKEGAATNLLLREYDEAGVYYSKTLFGRSDRDGDACAAVAELNGFDALAVVMGCEQTEDDAAAYRDIAALFEWAEDGFSYQSIVRKNQPISRVGVDLAWSIDTVALVAKQDVNAVLSLATDLTTLRYDIVVKEELLNADGNLTAPVDRETQLATARVYDGEILLAEVPLYAASYVPRSQLLAVMDTVWTVFSSPFVLISLAVLVVLFVAYVIISVWHNKVRRQKKRRRMRKF